MCQLYNSPKGFCIAFCRWHAPPRLDTIWNCSHYPYLKNKKNKKKKKTKRKGNEAFIPVGVVDRSVA